MGPAREDQRELSGEAEIDTSGTVVDDDANPGDAGSEGDAVAPATRARRVGHHWGRLAELWVPEPLRDARVDPGRKGAVILLLVATLAAVATAIGVWRDRPEPRPVATSALAALRVSASSGPPAAAGTGGDQANPLDTSQAGGSTAASTEIVVSVTGLVGNPGLVTLPADARVADALAAAGGAGPEADLTGLNLAARLADGASVVVGSAPGTDKVASGVTGAGSGAGIGSAGATPSGGLINLNTADEAALDTLPGVGPVMAQNIITWRETNGRFSTVEQLQEISGIGPARFAQISALVAVS